MAIVTGPGPSLRSQWLGEKLRELRMAKKMSLRVAGQYLQRDASTMSRYENGEYPLRHADLIALMTLYDVSDSKQRADLEQICEDAWQRDWWDQHKEDFGKDFINLPWLESRATRICTFHLTLVEGLLQTRGYAEALVRNADEATASEDQIKRWIDLRMDRQQILLSDDAPRLSVILDESILYRSIGSEEVWHGQLHHLVEQGQRDNIDIRILPFTASPHRGHKGGFMLFEMPDPYPQVAYLDTHVGQLFIEEPAVLRLTGVWKDIDMKAVDHEESTRLIMRHLEEPK